MTLRNEYRRRPGDTDGIVSMAIISIGVCCQRVIRRALRNANGRVVSCVDGVAEWSRIAAANALLVPPLVKGF